MVDRDRTTSPNRIAFFLPIISSLPPTMIENTIVPISRLLYVSQFVFLPVDDSNEGGWQIGVISSDIYGHEGDDHQIH